MARNIYSPLMISSISFFFVFIIVIVIFTSTRLNEDYITKQVNKNKATVSSLKSKNASIVSKQPSSLPSRQPNRRNPVSSRTSTRPVQRRV